MTMRPVTERDLPAPEFEQASQVEQSEQDITDDQCIELAEALVWEAIRRAIAGTKEIADHFQEGSFRAGMETACEEIEARLGMTASAQMAVGHTSSAERLLELVNDLVVSWVEDSDPGSRIMARKKLEQAIREAIAHASTQGQPELGAVEWDNTGKLASVDLIVNGQRVKMVPV